MSEAVPTLKGAQDDIRAAFFGHETGLFVLNCVPGFGKSLTVERIAGELLVRLYEAGVQCPERCLCVTSFSRDDAASLEPGIRDALEAFAADDVDTAIQIDEATAEHLEGRLQHAEHLGTIDSVLRSVFNDIATELGFDGMPSVGNDALQTTLEEECIAALRDDLAHAGTFATLDRAYPDDEDGVDDLLDTMRNERRSRRLSHDEFRARLHETIDDVYPSGKPNSIDDIHEDIVDFYDEDTAAAFVKEHTTDTDDAGKGTANGDGDTTEAKKVVEADRVCHEEWTRCIDLLCELLEEYEALYDQKCRERGVLDYTDVAYWIAEFFERPPSDFAGGDAAVTRDYRDRLTDRYARQFQAIILDEAQDVSIVQHDALAQIVPDDAKVLLAADRDQCVYEWRTARPSLFQRAFEDGRYFATDWSNHETELGTTSYRMRPDIAHSVKHVFSTAFTSPDYEHGSGEYTPIDSDRSSTSVSNVHVLNSSPRAILGSPEWTNQEAVPLSRLVRGYVSDGTLDLRGNDAEPLIVLFRKRTNMDAFADAFRELGFSVANGSRRLFDDPLVKVVCAVVSWLVNPHDPERIATLLKDDSIPFSDPREEDDDQVDDISALKSELENDSQQEFVDRLRQLAARQPRFEADPGVYVVEAIIEILGLQSDPLDQTDDDRQRLTALDSLIDAVNDWEDDDRYSISELADILARYRSDPKRGPQLTVANPDAYDIVFRTCHGMKGAENRAVCIVDATEAIDSMGHSEDTFCARGDTLALAPPETVEKTPVKTEEGLHGEKKHCGLRWVADFQVDDQTAGPPPLTRIQARHRAEQWRLLYVAMTRARDDLILSLPPTDELDAPDSWTVTIRALFGLDKETSTCNSDNAPVRAFSFRENDAPLDAPNLKRNRSPHRAAQEAAPTQTGLTPRNVNGSQLHPFLSDPAQHWLNHLRNRSLQTETTNPDQTSELILEEIDPDTVGRIAHAVLAAAVANGVSTDELRSCSPPLENRLDESLNEYAPAAPQVDRKKVRSFVVSEICPQFAETAAWDRLRKADQCYIEDKLSSILDYDLETETHNRADIISVDPDRYWNVDEIKILLTSPEPKRRKQYEVQAKFYRILLERQLSSDVDVTPWVTYLGAETETTKAEREFMNLKHWIGRNI